MEDTFDWAAFSAAFKTAYGFTPMGFDEAEAKEWMMDRAREKVARDRERERRAYMMGLKGP